MNMLTEPPRNDAAEAIKLMSKLRGMDISATARKAGLTPRQLHMSLQFPERTLSQEIFRTVAREAFDGITIDALIAQAVDQQPIDMPKLAKDVKYLCEQLFTKRDFAKAIGMTELSLQSAFHKQGFAVHTIPRLLKVFGAENPQQIHDRAQEFRQRPQFAKEAIGTAARKIRISRALKKEDMPERLGCSKSEYALLETGESCVSMHLLNKLPALHGFNSMEEMMKVAADIMITDPVAARWTSRTAERNGVLNQR